MTITKPKVPLGCKCYITSSAHPLDWTTIKVGYCYLCPRLHFSRGGLRLSHHQILVLPLRGLQNFPLLLRIRISYHCHHTAIDLPDIFALCPLDTIHLQVQQLGPQLNMYTFAFCKSYHFLPWSIYGGWSSIQSVTLKLPYSPASNLNQSLKVL